MTLPAEIKSYRRAREEISSRVMENTLTLAYFFDQVRNNKVLALDEDQPRQGACGHFFSALTERLVFKIVVASPFGLPPDERVPSLHRISCLEFFATFHGNLLSNLTRGLESPDHLPFEKDRFKRNLTEAQFHQSSAKNMILEVEKFQEHFAEEIRGEKASLASHIETKIFEIIHDEMSTAFNQGYWTSEYAVANIHYRANNQFPVREETPFSLHMHALVGRVRNLNRPLPL